MPTTPEWTVGELVEHVGQTQHWVADIVERRVTDPARLPTEMAVLPRDPQVWPEWLAESSQRAARACSDEALDAPVWNAAGDERSGTRFWMASLLNEAVVHGFDAANAAGEPPAIEAEVAAALVTNHLQMLTSPTWEAQRPESARAIRGTGQTLQWRATDPAGDAGAWLVERRPAGATWRHGTQQADVTVSGPAAWLLLTMTRRAPLAEAEDHPMAIDGDIGLVRHWLDATAHVAD